jgi:predicted signal transduction protein with EAL and GGDEF domain
LRISDPGAIATGRAFTRLLDANNTLSREVAVLKSQLRDGGDGVLYQVQYAIQPNPQVAPIWVEDTGRWFAGPNGRPARADGTLRVITERHAELERLSYLSGFDDLTGEMNRRGVTERLDVVLKDAIRFRTSFGFLVVSIDDLARVNEAYGFAIGRGDRRLRQTAARQDAGQR